MNTDPLGHKLLQERIEESIELAAEMLDYVLFNKTAAVGERFIVTGIGSSEAHGRYFEELVNRYTPAIARFVPLGNFFSEKNLGDKKNTLVLFSQGLSPNAQIALIREKEFKHSIIFTSKKLGESKRRTVINIPIENEDGLLLRVIGPLLGYISIIQFININWPKSIPQVNPKVLITALSNSDKLRVNKLTLEAFKRGVVLLTEGQLCEYGKNLAYKLQEGAFIPMPPILDYLAFSHGTFQELIVNPKLVITLRTKNKADQYLHNKAKMLFKESNALPLEISSELPAPWNVLEFEMTLNYFILKVIKKLKINQKEWPGKTKDASLYNINKPLEKLYS